MPCATSQDYNYCCSKDGHGLKYPGFSVVFIQTFAINNTRQFKLPNAFKQDLPSGEDFVFHETERVYEGKADALKIPIARMQRNIESQIFLLPEERKGLPDDKTVRMYSLRGFDFEMPIVPEDGEFEPVTVKCHVNVEMALFFGHTSSVTYRFLFDGHTGELSAPAETDHIIAILSTYLGAEFWSRGKADDSQAENNSDMDINYETQFRVSGLFLDEEGSYLNSQGEPLSEGIRMTLKGKGRSFDEISIRYKRFIYSFCTVENSKASKEDISQFRHYRKTHPLTTRNDSRYAMADIWEDVEHPVYSEDKSFSEDLFSKDRHPKLSEADIVSHIQTYHKPELIGLLSLYPSEWPYRDAEAYNEVCGENIAIDTDDLVLAGSSLCMVLGTYGRRSDEAPADEDGGVAKKGVNWGEHLEQRARYGVSWPEYLLILQMVLAKKHIIGRANEILVNSTLSAENDSATDLIGKNAELSMRLSRMVLQLDVVKYSKFPSHKVMFDRTTKRMNLEEDMGKLNELMGMIDSSLHNLSDYKAMKSDFFLNFVLAIISVASTFELLFQNSEMPFLTYFGLESSKLAALLVACVAAVTIFALLLVMSNLIKSLWRLISKDRTLNI